MLELTLSAGVLVHFALYTDQVVFAQSASQSTGMQLLEVHNQWAAAFPAYSVGRSDLAAAVAVAGIVAAAVALVPSGRCLTRLVLGCQLEGHIRLAMVIPNMGQ